LKKIAKFAIGDEDRCTFDLLPVRSTHDLKSSKFGMNPTLPNIESLDRQFDLGKAIECDVDAVESAFQPVSGGALSESRFFSMRKLSAETLAVPSAIVWRGYRSPLDPTQRRRVRLGLRGPINENVEEIPVGQCTLPP
jgi:hypothetical protein